MFPFSIKCGSAGINLPGGIGDKFCLNGLNPHSSIVPEHYLPIQGQGVGIQWLGGLNDNWQKIDLWRDIITASLWKHWVDHRAALGIENE